MRFRSTPVLFVTDDHDYFDNDDATPERVALPPDAFLQDLRRELQSLCFPEFIAESEVQTLTAADEPRQFAQVPPTLWA